MRRVFVDTSAFFAHLVADDKRHTRARALFEQSAQDSWSLLTTNAVVWETYTLVRKRARASRALSLQFLEVIGNGLCEVAWVERSDEIEAVNLLREHADKEYSFCDVLSFVVMQRLNVTEAIAFDRDFESFGKFTLV